MAISGRRTWAGPKARASMKMTAKPTSRTGMMLLSSRSPTWSIREAGIATNSKNFLEKIGLALRRPNLSAPQNGQHRLLDGSSQSKLADF